NVPIGCAEVLVMPGDIMVGDSEGVVAIPRAVADTVATRGIEQDELERFILEKIKNGAPLPGTYPPGEATLAEFEAWKRREQARRPKGKEIRGENRQNPPGRLRYTHTFTSHNTPP